MIYLNVKKLTNKNVYTVTKAEKRIAMDEHMERQRRVNE